MNSFVSKSPNNYPNSRLKRFTLIGALAITSFSLGKSLEVAPPHETIGAALRNAATVTVKAKPGQTVEDLVIEVDPRIMESPAGPANDLAAQLVVEKLNDLSTFVTNAGAEYQVPYIPSLSDNNPFRTAANHS